MGNPASLPRHHFYYHRTSSASLLSPEIISLGVQVDNRRRQTSSSATFGLQFVLCTRTRKAASVACSVRDPWRSRLAAYIAPSPPRRKVHVTGALHTCSTRLLAVSIMLDGPEIGRCWQGGGGWGPALLTCTTGTRLGIRGRLSLFALCRLDAPYSARRLSCTEATLEHRP